MRALTLLGVLQTIGILVLLVHSFRDADRVVEQSPHNLRVAEIAPSPTSARVDDASLVADEESLRKIIREELAQLQSQSNAQDGAARPAVAARTRNDSANRYAQEFVAQQIETYRAVGSITNEQMLELQAAIAKLDEASRKQMMSRLIRALNSGDLEGRL